MAYRPQFTNVQFHPAYMVEMPAESAIQYAPSMTALDNQGRVWRTFQLSGGWQPWAMVMDTTDPFAS
jgi:hypothetical protein